MAKRLIFCLFFVLSTVRAGGEGDSVTMPMMMPYGATYGGRPDKMRDMTFADAFRVGGIQGVIEATAKLTSTCISELVLPFIRKTGAAGSTISRLVGRAIYGSTGFDPVELYGLRWTLERTIDTEILRVARGTKVIRQHLEQATDEQKSVQQTPFGMTMLKRDLTYLIEQLQKSVVRYRPSATTSSVADQMGDAAAAVGLSGAGCYGLYQMVSASAPCATSFLASRMRAVPMVSASASCAAPSLAPKMHAVPILDSAAPEVRLMCEMAKGEAQGSVAVSEPVAYNSVWQTIKTAVPYVIAAVAIARLLHAIHTGRAARAADAVNSVDRNLVCHLTDDLIGYLQQLLQLCDQVHDENDIARLKNKFEDASGHCGQLFAHLAYVIDAETATRLERAGKPGRVNAMQPLGGYMGTSHGY